MTSRINVSSIFLERMRFLLGPGGVIMLLHLAVPPLSVFNDTVGVFSDAEEIIEPLTVLYGLWPPGWLSKSNVTALALKATDATTPNWCHITHMFVHSNYAHLGNNLWSFLQLGSEVYDHVGNHAYVVFLLGGVAATLPSALKLEQFKHAAAYQVGRALSFLPFIPSSSSFPSASSSAGWLDAPLKQLNQSLSALVLPWVTNNTVFMGSSGGVCALAGCSLTIFVRDALCAAHRFWRFYNLNPSGSVVQRLERAAKACGLLPSDRHDNATASRTSLALVFRMASAASIAGMLYRNADQFHHVEISGGLIDKAAHIQGAAFGIAYALTLFWLDPLPSTVNI